MRLSAVWLVACASSTPAVPHATLVRTGDAGTNCANGGIAVATGVDADDSGALDDSEVATTSYACNGSNGNAGATGQDGSPATPTEKKVLSRATPLSAGGAPCPFGGTKIEVGFDDDGNGSLETGEVDGSAVVCGDDPFASVRIGNLDIRSQADANDAQNLTTVFGDVRIHLNVAGSVSLPHLALVQGRVIDCPDAGDNQATSVSLANAAAIIGGVELTCSPALASLDLGKVTATARLRTENAPLTTLNVSALRNVSNEVSLRGIAATGVSFPALVYVGGDLIVRDSPNFDDCALIAAVHAKRDVGARLRLQMFGNVTCGDVVARCPQVHLGAETGYRLCYYTRNWGDAEDMCDDIGGGWRLAYFYDEGQFTALNAAPQLISPDMDFWLGYTDLDNEGTFSWTVGPAAPTGDPSWRDTASAYTPIGAPFWGTGEPNDFGGAEDCAIVRAVGTSLRANDTPCAETTHYPLCRYHP